MVVPSRRDTMIKNLIKSRKGKIKAIEVSNKPKDPEEVRMLIEMWENNKK